jgi:hypothetical protein
MVSDRLKEIIFKKLYKDLSHVEIIPYCNHIWFIDRDKEHWYFRYDENGLLWVRKSYFENFFTLFSLSIDESLPLICEWFETNKSLKVSDTEQFGFAPTDLLNRIIGGTNSE